MRILIEHENPLAGAAMAEALEAAGHHVTICHGPSTCGGRECPLLEDRECSLVEDADVILAGLPTDKLEVYVALRDQCGVPVVLCLSRAERARLPILEQIGPWIPRELRGPRLARALDAVLERR
jgi:DNA-binding response OmpR family regulator